MRRPLTVLAEESGYSPRQAHRIAVRQGVRRSKSKYRHRWAYYVDEVEFRKVIRMQKQPDKVWAEDVNYFKTGKSSSDVWLRLAKNEIKRVKGVMEGEAFGSEANGRAAFIFAFKIGADQFKLVWPVLESRTKNEDAAKVQAATMLFHDIKAKCVVAKVMGARAAFLPYLLLPNGMTTSQASSAELAEMIPQLLGSGK